MKPGGCWKSTATSSTVLAKALEEREILDEREIEEIIGPSTRLAQSNGKAAERAARVASG